MTRWSNLAKVIYRRTYSRKDTGKNETWQKTIERVIRGNLSLVSPEMLLPNEANILEYLMLNRKATPAGRGLWFSGSPAHEILGGAASCNCYFFTADNWEHYVHAQDLLMLGGGVGLSVENRYVSCLPLVKEGVNIVHKFSKDADFIVPDSREGWVELTRKVLQSFFETGVSFSFSTYCIRGAGEPIKGFGGTSSGGSVLVDFIQKLCTILKSRSGRKLRSIDAADILCCISEMVIAGNVRRSALMILGDCYDKEFLKAKRWDLKQLPSYRAMANFSVNCSDVNDLHPLFWETYTSGEAFGIVNIENCQNFGRMGELNYEKCLGINPCSEATLMNGESCNLQNIAMPNIDNLEEFKLAAKMMHRYGKRVTMDVFHIPLVDEVTKQNRKIGTSITGCLQSSLYTPEILDEVYQAIQEENISYSNQLGINKSSRTTTINPAGTLSKIFDVLPGGHAAYSKYMIQNVRFSANDPLIPILKAAGHPMEPVIRFDGTLDNNTLVVSFFVDNGSAPTIDEVDTWAQLDTVMLLQKHWADQAVSTTVYYYKEDLPRIRQWLTDNLKNIKTVSFMLKQDHGFKQAPWQAISEDEYKNNIQNIQPISEKDISGDGVDLNECQGGSCPIK